MTAAEPKPRPLGRGLSALLGEDIAGYGGIEPARPPAAIGIDQLRPGRFQPRRQMPEEGLAELAQSIAERGVLQPILVRRDPGHPAAFEIVAGERRWRAAQMAGLHEVPVVIRELSDRDALAIGLVENLQRQDLTPLDEADGYRRLVEEFGNTQEDVARSVGKSRSHVANSLRLLTLSEPVKAMLANGALTAGHARPLIGVAGAEALARVIVQRGLNVRQTERLVAQYARGGVRPRPAPAVDANTRALERDLGLLLGVAVDIRPKGKGGALILHYRSLDQLDDILQRLSQGLRGRSLSAEPIADGD